MKITLDHNCILHLLEDTLISAQINKLLSNPDNEFYVVNIGASEMWRMGVRPDRYDKFEELLNLAKIAHLPRLNPMVLLSVTFLNRSVPATDEMINLANNIKNVLFGDSKKIDISKHDLDSPIRRILINRLCDIHGLWCHIYYKNDIFLTTDKNYTKETKLPKLIDLGAGHICHPNEL